MRSDNEKVIKSVEVLDGLAFFRVFSGGVACLGRKKAEVDSLNVFPVPDGDTGINMFLTMSSAKNEAEKKLSEKVGVVADAIAMGSLMGARGNSGVIISQLMRGIAKQMHSLSEIGTKDFAYALREASVMAYKAVMKPVEGTILTVAKGVGNAAAECVDRNYEDTMIGMLRYAIKQGQITLEKTPDMLPVLKEAGVVDAGGQGYIYFLRGMLEVLEGVAPQEEKADIVVKAQPKEEQKKVGAAFDTNIEFRYCTEFIITGENINQESIQSNIGGLGDCMLVVGTDEVVKVHIHTNNPGKVLQFCSEQGILHEIHINNMEDQHEELSDDFDPSEWSDKGDSPEAATPQPTLPAKDMAIVAISAGDGITSMFKSLGCDVIVTGGQTMNPSIQELVEAIKNSNGKEVIVLPNNSNIVLTANQAAKIVENDVYVIPTKTIPQGISAMIAMISGLDIKENVERMNAAVASVKSGEITHAVRDSKYNGLEIKENDIIGILDGDIVVAGKGKNEVVISLVDNILEDGTDMVTLIYGSSISEKEAFDMSDEIREKHPNVEIEIIYGGQPVYDYLIFTE